MQDQGWLWLVVLIVVGFLLRHWLTQSPIDQAPSDGAGGIKAPPVPEPPHVFGVPVGEAQLMVPPQSASDLKVPKLPPLPNQTAAPNTDRVGKKVPKLPSLPNQTAAPNTHRVGKKPPLIGQERIDWQTSQWEAQRRKKADENADRRAVAKQRQAEKETREKIEKAKGMAAAEARMAEEEAKKSARVLKASSDKERDQQRRDYLHTKIPARIQRDMDRFLAGEFEGPEQSPLTYVGYHVGVARGLSSRDRIERLEVCFRVPIPTELYAEYKGWGEPATTQRLNAMIAHIGRHAAIRSTQPKYDRAVAEWEADRAWLLSSLGLKADAFSERWIG
jgi:hypothetical protein